MDRTEVTFVGKVRFMNERPNFLVIMTDQQRGDCLSRAGHPVLILDEEQME